MTSCGLQSNYSSTAARRASRVTSCCYRRETLAWTQIVMGKLRALMSASDFSQWPGIISFLRFMLLAFCFSYGFTLIFKLNYFSMSSWNQAPKWRFCAGEKGPIAEIVVLWPQNESFDILLCQNQCRRFGDWKNQEKKTKNDRLNNSMHGYLTRALRPIRSAQNVAGWHVSST